MAIIMIKRGAGGCNICHADRTSGSLDAIDGGKEFPGFDIADVKVG
jgi:hypothetical protein